MTAAATGAFPHAHRVGRPSAEQSRELMAAVMQAAREEFAAKGFHHATMEAIAARAGVSKRTLYAWHADKAALLHAAVLDRAIDLTHYVIDPKEDLKDAIAAYSRKLLRELSTEYSMSAGALILLEARRFALAGEALQQGQEFLRRPLVTMLRDLGVPAGEAEDIGRLYIAALLGDMLHRMIMGSAGLTADQIRRHVAIVIAMFLPGLEARLRQIGTGAAKKSGENSH